MKKLLYVKIPVDKPERKLIHLFGEMLCLAILAPILLFQNIQLSLKTTDLT